MAYAVAMERRSQTMTIKEVEARTAMSRANIRFYESEGFISPARGENGYRDYAPEEVQVLLRIKLLRLLKLSLEEIREIHTGARPLPEALEGHIWDLEGEQHRLEQAQSICRTLLADGVSYDGLDARVYLDLLERAEVPELKQDVLPRVKAPWRRYFARIFDIALFGLAWDVVSRFLPQAEYLAQLTQLLDIFIPVLLTLLFEPLLLSTWGTTPGKWILGLSVADMEDHRLSRKEALERTWKAMWYGLGFSIPIYSAIRAWVSLGKCERGEEQPWEQNSVLHLKTPRLWRALVMAGAYGALFVILFGIQTFQPYDSLEYKGDLTKGMLISNYNALAEEEDYWVRLSEDGVWVRIDEALGYYDVVDETEMPASEWIEEGGIVTGIRISWSGDGWDGLYGRTVPEMHQALTYLSQAFICARVEAGTRSGEADILEDAFSGDNRYTSFTTQVGDVTVTARVEYEGFDRRLLQGFFGSDAEYELVGNLEAAEYYCELEYTMTINGD